MQILNFIKREEKDEEEATRTQRRHSRECKSHENIQELANKFIGYFLDWHIFLVFFQFSRQVWKYFFGWSDLHVEKVIFSCFRLFRGGNSAVFFRYFHDFVALELYFSLTDDLLHCVPRGRAYPCLYSRLAEGVNLTNEPIEQQQQPQITTC